MATQHELIVTTRTTDDNSSAALVVPFGKHKGKTVAELLAQDKQYVDWLMSQGWMAERFAQLHAAIISRGAAPDDTPEHNALQARFLDAGFCAACLHRIAPHSLSGVKGRTLKEVRDERARIEKAAAQARRYCEEDLDMPFNRSDEWKEKKRQELSQRIALHEQTVVDLERVTNHARCYLQANAVYEQQGVDVVIYWTYEVGDQDDEDQWFGNSSQQHRCFIELKPSLGDDFPSVMRQMERLGCTACIVGEYTGRGVAFEQVRQMFASNNFTLVFVDEIDVPANGEK